MISKCQWKLVTFADGRCVQDEVVGRVVENGVETAEDVLERASQAGEDRALVIFE
jgi:hypothetical protein